MGTIAVCPQCGTEEIFFMKRHVVEDGTRHLDGTCRICRAQWVWYWTEEEYEDWLRRCRQRMVESGENPLAAPPSTNPVYISRENAISLAGGDDEGARADARLMTRVDFEALLPEAGANYAPHRDRKVWVVSVHGEAWTRGGLRARPQLVNAYTVVIDAETGFVTDTGKGVAAFDPVED